MVFALGSCSTIGEAMGILRRAAVDNFGNGKPFLITAGMRKTTSRLSRFSSPLLGVRFRAMPAETWELTEVAQQPNITAGQGHTRS